MSTKAIVTEIPLNTCACQCGEPVGRRALYRPGHDARHVSMLLAPVKASGKADPKWIERTAALLPSEPLRVKFTRAAERLVTKQAEADAKEAN